jgi:hypothetical protein
LARQAFQNDIARIGFDVVPPGSAYGNRMMFALNRERYMHSEQSVIKGVA